jgi:hypothetical protein
MNRLLLPVDVLRVVLRRRASRGGARGRCWCGRPATHTRGRACPRAGVVLPGHRTRRSSGARARVPTGPFPHRSARSATTGHTDRPDRGRAQDNRLPAPPKGGQNGSWSATVGTGRVPEPRRPRKGARPLAAPQAPLAAGVPRRSPPGYRSVMVAPFRRPAAHPDHRAPIALPSPPTRPAAPAAGRHGLPRPRPARHPPQPRRVRRYAHRAGGRARGARTAPGALPARRRLPGRFPDLALS